MSRAGIKRWHNMSHDERVVDRQRRVPLFLRAIRDMDRGEIATLVAIALLLQGDVDGGKKVIDGA